MTGAGGSGIGVGMVGAGIMEVGAGGVSRESGSSSNPWVTPGWNGTSCWSLDSMKMTW